MLTGDRLQNTLFPKSFPHDHKRLCKITVSIVKQAF